MTKRFLKTNKLFKETKALFCLFFVSFIFFLPCFAFSEELPSIDDIIQKLQSSYENTKDLKADFLQETTIKSIRRTEREEGSIFFKNPKNMLWEYTKPQAKKLVMNSQTAWLYLPREKVVYTQKSENILQSKLLIKIFTGSGKFKDDFIITYDESKALDINGNYLLVLIPREKNSGGNLLKVTVDKNNFYILQVGFDDVLGNSTILKFSNISVNTGLAQKIFQFKIPAGVQVFKIP
jgi:outer membrane lipoprotein carrier protein